MKSIGQYPYGCELDYLQSAVIEKCDGDDGLTDGILLDPNSCEFDPLALVGTTFYCGDTGSRMKISQAAATVAKAYHMGARGPDGEFLWYGPNYGANLTRTIFGTPGLVATICTNRTCVGNPFEYGIYWTGLFAEKTPSFNFSSMSTEEYSRVFHLVAQEYASVFGTSDPDLSLFQEAGGKMISYHGLVSISLTSFFAFAILDSKLIPMGSQMIFARQREQSIIIMRSWSYILMSIAFIGILRYRGSGTATVGMEVSRAACSRPCANGSRTVRRQTVSYMMPLWRDHPENGFFAPIPRRCASNLTTAMLMRRASIA